MPNSRRASPRIAALLPAVGLLGLTAACRFDLEVPASAPVHITCQAEVDCPPGWLCERPGRCVTEQTRDLEAPTVREVSLSPTLVHRSELAVLDVTFSEPLWLDPGPWLDVDGAAAFVLDEARRGDASPRYRFLYAPGGSEPQGVDVPVLVSLEDLAGNTATRLLLGTLRFDLRLPRCGDGILDPDEDCDDGNRTEDDDCLSSCIPSRCGDGIVQRRGERIEACDDGNAGDGDACTTRCLPNVCGDAARFEGIEACDDGNTDSGDGCRADCLKVERCGDAVIDLGEACDDGNQNPADGCAQCRRSEWVAVARAGAGASGFDPAAYAPRGLWSVAVDRSGVAWMLTELGLVRLGVDGVAVRLTGRGLDAPRSEQLASATNFGYLTAAAVDGFGRPWLDGLYLARIELDGRLWVPPQLDPLGSDAGIALAPSGDLVLVLMSKHLVLALDPETGEVRHLAGRLEFPEPWWGVEGFDGDGGLATEAALSQPTDVTFDREGHLYIADYGNHRIRRVEAGTGRIDTVAGIGDSVSSGDGGPAASAALTPLELDLDAQGDLLVLDFDNPRTAVRRIELETGQIQAVAVPPLADRVLTMTPAGQDLWLGTLEGLYRLRAGELVRMAGGAPASSLPRPALSERLTSLVGVTVAADGALLVVESERLLRIHDGWVSERALSHPLGLVTDAVAGSGGHVLVADKGLSQIVDIDPDSGQVMVVAGTGEYGFSGDGGPASAAMLAGPSGLDLDLDGNLLIADSSNDRIRRVDALTGVITTVAGSGATAFAGDGDLATSAGLHAPSDVAAAADGGFYLTDYLHYRVRHVDAAGVIRTVAGNGVSSATGDGGPASAAQLRGPRFLERAPDGALWIAEVGDCVVRRIDASGTIDHAIGRRGVCSPDGDGGTARAAALGDVGGTFNAACDMAFDPGGHAYLACGPRLRRVDAWTGQVRSVLGPIDPPDLGALERSVLPSPAALAALDPATLMLASGQAGRVLRVDLAGGRLDAVAGYPGGLVGPEVAARFADLLGDVRGVAWDPVAGELWLSEAQAHRLLRITVTGPDPEAWLLRVGGGGNPAGHRDGALGQAQFNAPAGLALVDGALWIVDQGNHCLRVLDLASGEVRTVAGQPGLPGHADGPADQALFHAPTAVAVGLDGAVFVADTGNHRVRRLQGHRVDSVLGDGTASSAGEGSPARTFPVARPEGLAVDSTGNLFVAGGPALRVLLADDSGVVDGQGAVQTAYGRAPRTEFPQAVTTCLSGVSTPGPGRVYVADQCLGILVELSLLVH